jgi:phospho-N-acetylmuramoyl-pentapeptide-transferase
VLFLLGELLEPHYGPFRLLTSHIFLAGAAIVMSGISSWLLLPKLAARLPRDQGREFAVANEVAIGKPTSAGVVFVVIYLVIALLTVPWSSDHAGVLVLVLLAMLAGYWDDRRNLSEYTLASIDLVLSFAAAWLLCSGGGQVWLPFSAEPVLVPRWICVPVATGLIWLAINATNCTDGVDGLSGSLSALALVTLGGLLYFVLGHEDISAYLLLPHYADGAAWAISAFSMVGCLIGYLWYNAHPSELLMGDAGSRAVGLLTGVLVIKSGNPFMLFIVSGVLLFNGGTGLLKVALLRFARISIFKNVRFPLHDHVRHKSGWSNSQVLVRFALLQLIITMVFVVALVKIR